MDNLFFIISKLAWALVSPGNLLVILFILATGFLLLGWQVWAKRLMVLSSILAFSILAYPVGEFLIEPLESRFSQPTELPEKVDGIIILGGAEQIKPSLTWRQGQLGNAADRYIAVAKLVQQYPRVPVLFSGGNNMLRFQDEGDEGHIAKQILTTIGVKKNRLIIENKARNTFENFVFLKPLLAKPDGQYLLVTSAFHMPRAVGAARQQGINVIAYPVDYRSSAAELRQWDFNLFEHLEVLEPAWKEWVGLTVYFFTNKTSEWLASEE